MIHNVVTAVTKVNVRVGNVAFDVNVTLVVDGESNDIETDVVLVVLAVGEVIVLGEATDRTLVVVAAAVTGMFNVTVTGFAGPRGTATSLACTVEAITQVRGSLQRAVTANRK